MTAALYWVQDIGAGRLGVMPRPRGGDWLSGEIASLREQGVDVLVSLLTLEEVSYLQLDREEELGRLQGVEYISFPVGDRGVPASAEAAHALVRRLVALLASGHGVAVHCHGGLGRAPTLAACVLALCGVPVELAFARIAAARGTWVPETRAQWLWAETFARLYSQPEADA